MNMNESGYGEVLDNERTKSPRPCECGCEDKAKCVEAITKQLHEDPLLRQALREEWERLRRKKDDLACHLPADAVETANNITETAKPRLRKTVFEMLEDIRTATTLVQQHSDAFTERHSPATENDHRRFGKEIDRIVEYLKTLQDAADQLLWLFERTASPPRSSVVPCAIPQKTKGNMKGSIFRTEEWTFDLKLEPGVTKTQIEEALEHTSLDYHGPSYGEFPLMDVSDDDGRLVARGGIVFETYTTEIYPMEDEDVDE
jgi:hypothetical protein